MLLAAEEGLKEIVELLLKQERIIIDCDDIWIQVLLIIFKSSIFHWIEFESFMELKTCFLIILL